MPNTSVNFAPPSETLTTAERLAKLARILPVALDRANPPKIYANSSNDGQFAGNPGPCSQSSSQVANPSWSGRLTETKTKLAGVRIGPGCAQGHAGPAALVQAERMAGGRTEILIGGKKIIDTIPAQDQLLMVSQRPG